MLILIEVGLVSFPEGPSTVLANPCLDKICDATTMFMKHVGGSGFGL